MNKDYYITLISRRLSSELNAAELKVLNTWLHESKDNANLLQEFRNIWAASGTYKQNISFNADASFEGFREKYLNEGHAGQSKSEAPDATPGIGKWALGIALLAAILLTTLVLVNSSGKNRIENTNMSALTVELNPSARLTLSPDSRISKITANNTPGSTGGDRIQLDMITDLDDTHRENLLAENLVGQAYFDIRNLYHSTPYTVAISNGITIAAHDARFNVQNFPDESTLTLDVESGQVLFDSGDRITSVSIGQRLEYNKATGKIVLGAGPGDNPFNWRKGILEFNNTPLKEVFESIERFYGVEIIITDNSPVEGHFTAFNLKPASLNEVLELLQASIDMHIIRKDLDRVEISRINAGK